MELRISVSTADIDGITCVCTTSIIGSSSSSSLLPPAVTHGCRLISESYEKNSTGEHWQMKTTARLIDWLRIFSLKFQGYETNFKSINQIKLTVSRFSGLTSIIPRKRFWQSGGTKCGMWNTPRLTFSSSCLRLSSSNGRAPTSKAYKITPHDHTSARRPSYFSPYKEKMCREL